VVVAVVVLVGIWQAYVDIAGVSHFVLPSPGEVLSALVDDRSTLWLNLKVTAVEIVCGIALATVLGVAAAVGLHFCPGAVRRGLYPLIVASQAIPTVILAPILVIWLGFGLFPKLIVIALVCFFPILVTTLAGFEAVDREMIKLLRTFDAGPWQIFRHVELPSALPGLFTGMKLAAVFAVIGAVFAEWSGSTDGLGYLLTVTISNLETAETFATVMVLAALAIFLFATFEWVERLTLPWFHKQIKTPAR
jgi:ABC-type nitrate/sulfonate/bicarbonate transport system permease component